MECSGQVVGWLGVCICWTERVPLVGGSSLFSPSAYSRRIASVWLFSVLWLQGAGLAFGLAWLISLANQFVMRAISARMQRCGSGGSGWSVVVRVCEVYSPRTSQSCNSMAWNTEGFRREGCRNISWKRLSGLQKRRERVTVLLVHCIG